MKTIENIVNDKAWEEICDGWEFGAPPACSPSRTPPNVVSDMMLQFYAVGVKGEMTLELAPDDFALVLQLVNKHAYNSYNNLADVTIDDFVYYTDVGHITIKKANK